MIDWENARPEDIRGKTHAELYPDQYTHSLCGKRVRTADGKTGKVRRVVQSRFGPLAILDSGEAGVAHSITTLTVEEQ